MDVEAPVNAPFPDVDDNTPAGILAANIEVLEMVHGVMKLHHSDGNAVLGKSIESLRGLLEDLSGAPAEAPDDAPLNALNFRLRHAAATLDLIQIVDGHKTIGSESRVIELATITLSDATYGVLQTLREVIEAIDSGRLQMSPEVSDE